MKATLALLCLYCLSCVFAAETNVTATVTLYGAGDNCPPGGAIAYPQIHKTAGGVGSWQDPITYAGSKAATPAGTIIYIPKYQKYFIMEDDCEECDADWAKKKYHIDLWLGPEAITAGTTDCENAFSFSGTITLNAVSGHTYNSTQFFENGKCAIPVDHCVDQGNQCGNECEIPSSMSCQAAANMFLLTLTRFQQLNPKIDCSKNIPSGTSVCQAGSCGGP